MRLASFEFDGNAGYGVLVDDRVWAASAEFSEHFPDLRSAIAAQAVAELAENVIDLTGSKSKMVNKPLPEDDPRQRQPDITLAKTNLDWEPTIALREGLTKTIAYFDDLLKTHTSV